MTKIRGFIEASRRPGVLGVHSLDHFSLTVPDLEQARSFYVAFGLDVRPDGQRLGLYTPGHPHRWGTLTEGPHKKLHYLSFAAFEDDLPRFRERLDQLALERLPPPVLGLRLSDASEGNVAFMHGVHGSDHHLVAFARSDGPGLHHCSWDVGAVQDVGLGAMQMANKGFVAGWGMGRHVLGANYFHYVRDPWGSYSEYSADMDYIPATTDWEAGEHPGEDSFYLWGPTPPADFGLNYETKR